MNYQFKILEGTHTGASIDLVDQQVYQAVNDYNHDIYLPINSDNKISFTFIINDNKIIINESSNDIYCNNSKLLAKNNEYNLPLFLQSHNLKFVICESEQQIDKWVDVTKQENEINTETILQHMLAEKPTNENDMIDDDILPLKTKKTTSKNNTNKLILPLKIWFKEKQKTILLILSGIIILLIALTSLTYYSHTTSKLQLEQESISSQTQIIKKHFQNLPSKYSGLKLLTNNNRFTLIGVVDNNQDINELKKYFAKYLSQIDFSLIESNNAIQKVTQILSARQLKTIKVNYDATNLQLNLSGILDSLSEVNDIELDISNQIPSINNLDTSKIFQKSDIEKDLDKIIDTKLAPRLTINKDWNLNLISISGFLTNEELKQFEANIKDLTEKYQNVFKVNLNIKDALNIIPFNISQVYTGNPQFIVTSKGQKVFVGGEIAGFKVASIDQNKIIFSGKFPVTIPLDKITTNNNSSKNNVQMDAGRQEIIQDEKKQENDSLNKEQKYLDELIKLKEHTTDAQLLAFINEHINNLQQDIETKQKELEYYNNKNDNKVESSNHS